MTIAQIALCAIGYGLFIALALSPFIVGARADDPLPNHKARSCQRNSEGAGKIVQHGSADNAN